MLTSLGIRYVIGGSVAATIYGEPRATLDLDVVIEADGSTALKLVERLRAEFYVEEEDALQAVRYGTSFNAIHYDAGLKIDFFIAEKSAKVREQFNRARVVELAEGPASFYSPEDVVVWKLKWYRMGGEESDRQWRDIIGILRLAQEPLDDAYLDRMAAAFEVTDLLVRARNDAAHP